MDYFPSYLASCLVFSHFVYYLLVGKTVTPKAANEVKLINSGKILENNKTVGQCKVPFGDFAGGVIIMHVVVQPSLAKTKAGKFVWISLYKEYISCFSSIEFRSSDFFFLLYLLRLFITSFGY